MGKSKMSWNDAADQKLLLKILATSDIKFDYKALALSFRPRCSSRAIQKRVEELMLKAKNDDASSPDSTSSKFTNAAVPKPKVDTKRKASNGSSQAVKKRKIKNGDVAVIEIDSEEEGLPSRVNGAGKSKSKVDGMLVSDDGKDGHEMVKEEPFTSDEFLSDISAFDLAEN